MSSACTIRFAPINGIIDITFNQSAVCGETLYCAPKAVKNYKTYCVILIIFLIFEIFISNQYTVNIKENLCFLLLSSWEILSFPMIY